MADTSITIRLPQEILDKADALVPRLQADPELATFGRVSRAAVIRLALLRGLRLLQELPHLGVADRHQASPG